MKKRFAITGVAGYIAPRHLRAIKDTGNELIAALDPHDSVGILDQYFPDTRYFQEYERFDRYLEKLRRQGTEKSIDFVTICAPNYLHDAHIRTALRVGANAICEKPLVLNPWNVEALQALEEETGKRVFTVLQLRLHPAIVALKEKYRNMTGEKVDIKLSYITSRGHWYLNSWKGNSERSGGLATNIGIHFFDMLTWIFGSVVRSELHFSNSETISGFLELEHARVRWFLSVSEKSLPPEVREKGQRTYRSINVNGEDVEFSSGFTDLHTEIYRKAVNNEGFGIQENVASIDIVHNLRHAEALGVQPHSHSILKNQ